MTGIQRNIVIGDYKGNLEDSLMLIIGADGNYFKYKMSEKEHEDIIAGLEYSGILKTEDWRSKNE